MKQLFKLIEGKVKLSAISDRTGISTNLLRQYKSGAKTPSRDRMLVIEKAINDLGAELMEVKL